METNDKHCQTFIIKISKDVNLLKENSPKYNARQMYDETVPVLNAKEVKSPSGSDSDSQVSAAMSKFNPPVRHTARHDFESESDSDSDVENFLDNASDEDKSPERQGRPSNRPSAASRRRQNSVRRSPERHLSGTRPSPERQNGAQRSPQRQSDARRSPERQSGARLSPQRQSGARRSPQRQSSARRSPQRQRGAQRSLERRNNARRSAERKGGDDRNDLDFGRKQQQKAADSSDNTESDSNDLEMDRPTIPFPPTGAARKRGTGLVIPAEGAYDPKHFQDLKVSPEMENIFQYIMKYTPQKVDIEFKLQPFVPDYVPAVGDIDPFIKVTTPACGVRGTSLTDKVLEHIDNLGLTVLDEPSAEQSDSALLHLQLRALSKCDSGKSTVLTKKIEFAEKNPRAIERWIKDVSELHLSKPAPNVNYAVKMPDIDSLMEEWPALMEETLNEVGFPRPNIDCSLSEYVSLVCGTFDIPIPSKGLNDYIQALHVLFSLFLAMKNSQLYAERQKEDKCSSNV